MNKIFGPFYGGRAAVGMLAIRIVFGVGIILHGWDKVVNGGPFHWADSMGPLSEIPHPLQAVATFTEIGAGLAMIAGLLTPLAMLGLTITMTVALLKGHHGEPYVSLDRPFKPTYEVVAHYGLIAIGLLLAGPGTLSLDYLLFGRRARPSEIAPGALKIGDAPPCPPPLCSRACFSERSGRGRSSTDAGNAARCPCSSAWR